MSANSAKAKVSLIVARCGGQESFVKSQWREAKGEQPKVHCVCGASLPLRFLFRCLYCGTFFCRACAEDHFGMTVREYREKKARGGL